MSLRLDRPRHLLPSIIPSRIVLKNCRVVSNVLSFLAYMYYNPGVFSALEPFLELPFHPPYAFTFDLASVYYVVLRRHFELTIAFYNVTYQNGYDETSRPKYAEYEGLPCRRGETLYLKKNRLA